MELYLTNWFYLKTNKIENANILILNHWKTTSKNGWNTSNQGTITFKLLFMSEWFMANS